MFETRRLRCFAKRAGWRGSKSARATVRSPRENEVSWIDSTTMAIESNNQPRSREDDSSREDSHPARDAREGSGYRDGALGGGDYQKELQSFKDSVDREMEIAAAGDLSPDLKYLSVNPGSPPPKPDPQQNEQVRNMFPPGATFVLEKIIGWMIDTRYVQPENLLKDLGNIAEIVTTVALVKSGVNEFIELLPISAVERALLEGYVGNRLKDALTDPIRTSNPNNDSRPKNWPGTRR
jgi:hypothetical protein